jgi:hypothetical protein
MVGSDLLLTRSPFDLHVLVPIASIIPAPISNAIFHGLVSSCHPGSFFSLLLVFFPLFFVLLLFPPAPPPPFFPVLLPFCFFGVFLARFGFWLGLVFFWPPFYFFGVLWLCPFPFCFFGAFSRGVPCSFLPLWCFSGSVWCFSGSV